MKCLVLAGGSGDRLWPLSRKNYPKQFMEIRKGRSMFQETVLRNIPFCDEFVIVTNKMYENIVKGQLQDFQNLKYTLILEEITLKTALSVLLVAVSSDKDEELLIAPTDHIIEGDYNTCIVQMKEIVKDDKIAIVGIKPKKGQESATYVDCVNGKVSFTNRKSKYSYFDCGILAGKVSAFLDSFDPDYKDRFLKLNITGNVLDKEVIKKVRARRLNDVLNPHKMQLINADFKWVRITDISSYYDYIGKDAENNSNIISNQNKNVKIINRVDDQLIVASGLKNIIITNTRDALLISSFVKEKEVKEITKKHYDEKRRYFDECSIIYEKWGHREVLNTTGKCVVSRITIYPDRVFYHIVKKGHVDNFFISEGEAKIHSSNDDQRYCSTYSSILFTGLTAYSIANEGSKNLVLIFTENDQSVLSTEINSENNEQSDCFVKLEPVLKNFIWGGTRIRDVLKKDTGNLENVAECWELSAHPAGQSKIATGPFTGKGFNEFITLVGKEQLGWKAQAYERFPLMIKFIDAKQNLSIQVHPDDEYAFPVEGDYGKNEMWYIMEADEDACIYVGFNRDVTKEEIKERIKNNTLIEVLNKVRVKQGETYFLRAGTVHAIGAGCFVCEIQQSSNITYRLYDYNRRDKDGNLRELHLDKALDVLNLKATAPQSRTNISVEDKGAYKRNLLGECKYFTAAKYEIDGQFKLYPSEASFHAVVIIEGNGEVSNGKITYPVCCGDTLFAGCNETISFEGAFTAIIVNI